MNFLYLLDEKISRLEKILIAALLTVMILLVAFRMLLGLGPDEPIPACEVRMGTTLATNALLERRGCPTVMVADEYGIDVIVLGERHLLRLIQQHMRYYNEDRPHMALRGDAPVSRAVRRPGSGRVIALSRVGGVHHRYARAA